MKVIIGLPKFVRTEKFSPNKFGACKFVINHWLKPVAWIEHSFWQSCYGL
ncbi:MAG: hypothetical protein NZ805_07620 [Armatimonadetes bacterium]|nr:hypothetical protein [Armatimonadota bacterium]